MRHSHPILICCMLGVIMAACGKQEPDSLNLLSNAVNLPSEGGSEDVSIMTNQTWSASTDQDWLRVAPASGGASASYQPITLSAVENTSESARQATVTVKAGTVSKTINVTQAGTPRFTIADFKAKKADKVTWYKLSGEVASIANETYGNFYIFDETGYVYVYGLGEKKVESNDQSFSKLNLKVGDIVTMMTLRSEHNGVIEAGGTIPAYFVSKEGFLHEGRLAGTAFHVFRGRSGPADPQFSRRFKELCRLLGLYQPRSLLGGLSALHGQYRHFRRPYGLLLTGPAPASRQAAVYSFGIQEREHHGIV